jgi:hypothetical protein
VAAATGLWFVIIAAAGASLTVASMRWPRAMLDAAVVLSVAACSSLVTAMAFHRRAHRD